MSYMASTRKTVFVLREQGTDWVKNLYHVEIVRGMRRKSGTALDDAVPGHIELFYGRKALTIQEM